jgi:hypothetical protein
VTHTQVGRAPLGCFASQATARAGERGFGFHPLWAFVHHGPDGTLPDDFDHVLPRIPKRAWTPAYDAGERVRDGAWVADVTGLLNPAILSKWPTGMRVIARKERPPPGAQLRLTDVDGHPSSRAAAVSRR